MDPLRALDMEVRSGISSSEIDDFASRMDMIAQAMDEIKSGTFDPAACKTSTRRITNAWTRVQIPGYKTPEQEEAERLAKLEREQERERRETERKRKLKHDERANWWTKAKLRYSVDGEDASSSNNNNSDASLRNAERTQVAANRALAAYTERDANDYSVWSTWEPQDPVTLDETAAREAELERERNRAFEASNPEFCSQFKADLEKRQSTQREKERAAEKLKQQGNACYRRKQYAKAIEHYMKALDASPFSVAVLANLAQCYLRLQDLDDAIEFSTRALFIDPDHVKALSRRAAARHLQQQWHDAAKDMERALQLEPLNEDVVEQHSIIVGDYDDSVAQQQLDAVMSTGSKPSPSSAAPSTTADELRFVVELLQRMDDSAAAASDANQEETTGGESTALAKPMWIAYELLLPLLERNESVRTLVRTSGELRKLCNRIVAVITAERFAKTLGCDHDQELVVHAMLACATAAMASCPRNQIVMYQDAPFRKNMLAALTTGVGLEPSTCGSDAVNILPWSTQASVLQFFEEAVELKSWKRLIATTPSALRRLLHLLPLTQTALTAKSTTQECRTFEALAQERLVLSTSSICVTLSSDEHTLQEFANEASACAQSIAKALEQATTALGDTRVVTNVLGFLTNLSTLEAIRAAVDSDGTVSRNLVQTLLRIALDGAVAAVTTRDATSPERALAALLNLSFHPNARVRRDLLTCGALSTLTSILETMAPTAYTMQALTLSRAIGLLCRLHAVVPPDASKVTESSNNASYSTTVIETAEQLMHSDLLDELYRVCLHALSTAGSPSTTSAPPSETWQLCAQIWCHVGWCVHAPSVRTYLRNKRALHAITETVRLANAQEGAYRSVAPGDDASARERLVGNAVKVLITLQSERKDEDLALFAKPAHLATLVAALQALPDGLARKNVAILLAKLCQADARVKDEVRKLRGIEMLLSVSQSLQQQAPAPLLKTRSGRHAAPGAAF